MIQFVTPEGERTAFSEIEALKLCEKQAEKEMIRNGTRLYTTTRYEGKITIRTGNSIWIIKTNL